MKIELVNLVAVGSLDPWIEIWDLNIMDSLEADFVLGDVNVKKKLKKIKVWFWFLILLLLDFNRSFLLLFYYYWCCYVRKWKTKTRKNKRDVNYAVIPTRSCVCRPTRTRIVNWQAARLTRPCSSGTSTKWNRNARRSSVTPIEFRRFGFIRTRRRLCSAVRPIRQCSCMILDRQAGRRGNTKTKSKKSFGTGIKVIISW